MLHPGYRIIAAGVDCVPFEGKGRVAVVIAVVKAVCPVQGAVEGELEYDRVAVRRAIVHIEGADKIAVGVLLDGFYAVG